MDHLAWRTSSYTEDGSNCVEVTPVGPGWRTSSYTEDGDNCVEVTPTSAGVLLRDTKDHGTGPIIAFTAAQWTAFLTEVATDAPSTNGAATTEPHATGMHLHSPAGVRLDFTPGEWAAFRAGVRDGEFSALVPA